MVTIWVLTEDIKTSRNLELATKIYISIMSVHICPRRVDMFD